MKVVISKSITCNPFVIVYRYIDYIKNIDKEDCLSGPRYNWACLPCRGHAGDMPTCFGEVRDRSDSVIIIILVLYRYIKIYSES